MAESKNSAKFALKKSFLPSRSTLEGPVRPQNAFETLLMVISYGLGYGISEKTQTWGLYQLFVWGFFHPWANSAQCAQKVKKWKKPHILRSKSATN